MSRSTGSGVTLLITAMLVSCVSMTVFFGMYA